MMRRLFIFVMLFGLGLGMASAAELTTGTIEGSVTDQDGNAVAGAIITLMGPQGVQTTTTNDRGSFTFRSLTSGTYKVKAEAANFAPMVQTDVRISINTKTQLPFVLTAGMTEEITVVSQAPIVDLKSTSTGATIKIDDFAPYVPLGRNLTSIFSIAPGVSDGGDPVLGSTNSSISGSSGLENAYFVDGVNITNSGYGALGAYSIVYGSLGTGVTYDFLEEVQVKTGGFEAEFGQAGGGIVNSVVKTGTNRFGFDVSWYEEPASLEASRGERLDSPNLANRKDTIRSDIAATVSGPILKDKVFYFAAYNPITLESDFKLTSGDAGTEYFLTDTNGDGFICDGGDNCFDPIGGPAGGPATVLNTGQEADDSVTFDVGNTISGGRLPSEVTRERTIDNYAAKISAFVTPNHKVEVSAFGDPSDGEVGPQSPTTFLRNLGNPIALADPTSGATGLDWGGDQYAIKYQGVWSSNFFTEIQFSHKENEFSEIGPGVNSRSFFDVENNNVFGGAGFYEELADDVDQWALKNTHVFGPVEISYGYQKETIEWAQPRLRSGPTYTGYFPLLIDGFDAPGPLGEATTGFVASCDPGAETFVDTDGDGVTDGGCYRTLQSTTGATVDWLGTDTGDPSDDTYNVTRTVFTEVGQPTDAEESNAFVQATWSVLPNVTLKLGARWTEQELTGSGSETLPLRILEDDSAVGVGAGVGDAELFTSLSAQSYKFDSEIAPRIGVTWDVMNNGKHKLYANYGEYYQRVPSDLAVRAFSNEVGTTDELFNDADLSDPNLNDNCGFDSTDDGFFDSTMPCHYTSSIQGLAGGGSIILDGSQQDGTWVPFDVNEDGTIDPGEVVASEDASDVFVSLDGLNTLATGDATKMPYTKEYLGGWAWEINDYTGFELRWIHRELGRVLEDVQFASNEQTWNLFWGDSGGAANEAFGDPFEGHGAGAFGAYVFANVGDNVSTGVFPVPTRDYDALEVIFNRRFHGGWMAYANYRFARLHGIYEGSFRNDNGQSDPFLTSLFDFPAASAVDSDPLADDPLNPDGRFDNDFDTFLQSDTLAGQYINGPLNTERRHIFNGFVAKQFDFGLNVGGRINIQSGQPRGPLFAHPTYRNAGEVPGTNPEYWWGVTVDTDLFFDTWEFDILDEFGAPGLDEFGDPVTIDNAGDCVTCDDELDTGDGDLLNDTDGYGFYTNSDAQFDVDGILTGDTSTDYDGDGTNDRVSGEATGPRLFSYDFVQRDAFGRTPTIITFDVSASYDFTLRDGKSKVTLLLDVFNIFNDNDAIRFDNNVETRPGTPNVDYLKANAFQGPRNVRVGAKFTW